MIIARPRYYLTVRVLHRVVKLNDSFSTCKSTCEYLFICGATSTLHCRQHLILQAARLPRHERHLPSIQLNHIASALVKWKDNTVSVLHIAVSSRGHSPTNPTRPSYVL